jgi:hypothetical protein
MQSVYAKIIALGRPIIRRDRPPINRIGLIGNFSDRRISKHVYVSHGLFGRKITPHFRFQSMNKFHDRSFRFKVCVVQFDVFFFKSARKCLFRNSVP